MKNKRNRETVEKSPSVTVTMPHLREIKGMLDSLATKLETAPNNQSRSIWKNVINAVRDDVKKYEQKLLEGLPPMSTVERV